MANIVYVARDIERALGMDPSPMYRIVTNRSIYAESIASRFPDYITLVDGQSDTIDLLAHKASAPQPGEALLVFKNTPAIEAFCAERTWKLLNPSAALAERIENKITQVEYLGTIGAAHFPPHTIGALGSMAWDGSPKVIQWAHGHTGGGTILVSSEAEFTALQKKFPERPARATAVITGPSFTVNAVVTASGATLVGNISYQITGLSPFTDSSFATVGNDWSATHTILSDAEIGQIQAMATEIGAKLHSDGWRGLFGIDIMKDVTLEKLYLIEINARQPASTTLESRLQEEYRRHGIKGATTFEAHIDALNGSGEGPLIEINDGAQIVQRITATTRTIGGDVAGSLELAGYTAIAYENTALGSDLIRIQSSRGIIDALGKLNERGQEIAAILSDGE